nr:hypothetical protein [Tanacetum cinerariifolium]
MEIDDDDADKDDDFEERNEHLTGFGVFVHDKPKELPKFTPISPTVTCLSLEVYTMLLNDPLKNKLTNNHKENYEEADDQHMSPPPATTIHNHITNPQQSSIQAKASLIIAKSRRKKLNFKHATVKKFKEVELKPEGLLKTNVPEAIKDKYFLSDDHHNDLYNALVNSMNADEEQANVELTLEPTLKKRPHDDQDLPNDHEGEKDKKRR